MIAFIKPIPAFDGIDNTIEVYVVSLSFNPNQEPIEMVFKQDTEACEFYCRLNKILHISDAEERNTALKSILDRDKPF